MFLLLNSVHTSTYVILCFRYGASSESPVSQQDVLRFESKWKLPVLKIRNNPPGHPTSSPERQLSETAIVLNLICDQLWSHQTTRFEPTIV